jgi:hypothetical protein
MKIVRRPAAALAVLVVAFVVGASVGPVASAGTQFPVHQDIYATTKIKKSGMTVQAPKGSFDGSVDLDTGDLSGMMSIPPSTMTVSLLGLLPVADISFAMEPTGPTTGHVDFATLQSTTTSRFNIRLTKMTPHGSDTNLVGDDCKTSSPISITISGPAAISTASSLSGTFTIPDFANCRTMTQLLNALIPGPGNTFSAVFGPSGTPPPPPPAEPEPLALEAHNLGVNVTAGGQTLPALPPLDLVVPTPVPAPPPDGGLLGWLFQTR